MRINVLAALIVWPVAFALFGVMFLFGTPVLEASFYPVLRSQAIVIDAEDRSPGRMCWTWKWDKVRHAQPIAISWSILVDGTTVELPLVVQRQRDGEIVRDVRASNVGPGQNDLCAVIPAEIDRLTGLTIRGQINYRLPHNLWTIWQEMPVVRVPALP